MTRPTPVFRALERLEPRENPSGGLPAEGFEQVSAPVLPTGWNLWASDGQQQFITTRLQASEGRQSLASLGSSRVAARYWSQTTVGPEVGFAASVHSSTPAPVQVIVRGAALDTTAPSFVAAVVRNGGTVELVEVRNGVTTSLGTVRPTQLLYNTWLRVSVKPVGDKAGVTVQRADTGQYLTAQGTWQTGAAEVLRATVAGNPSASQVGIGRATGGGGMAYIDDLTALAPPGVNESFDATANGALPSGWTAWANDGAARVRVSAGASVSPANALAADGDSPTQARAWSTGVAAADATVSASVFADSLIPAGVVARGQNLNTAAPTYYALTLTRGLTIQLKRVVDGAETTLATVRSTAWTNAVWVRLSLTVQGTSLSALVYRADTRQWLTADGKWSDSPDQALAVTDGGIARAGFVGVERSRSYAGTVRFDDFEMRPPGAATGPAVTVSASPAGPRVGRTVTLTAATAPAGAEVRRVEFRVDGKLRAMFDAATAHWEWDTTRYTNGRHVVSVRAIDANGSAGTAEATFEVNNAGTAAKPSRPTGVRKYTHIRLAQLAYDGNPLGSYEQNLAKNSLDLIIPNEKYLPALEAAAPTTPKVIYTNVSNIYGNLLTDWLTYADATGAARESAFYHVVQPTAFSGESPAAVPVNRFTNVSTVNGTAVTDVSGPARGAWGNGVPVESTLVIGYPDKFRELNVALNRAAAGNWAGAFEYVSAVDAAGNPTAWKTVRLTRDGTGGFRTAGRIEFDPPADWVAARQPGGTQRLLQIRIRTTAGNTANAPILKTVFGRDYVGANGTDKGTIPAFDQTADKDGDGYLTDAEYAGRKTGSDARFAYESRLFYPYYGQMRFVTNPSSTAVRTWAADYHERLLNANPLADGLFVDNSHGKLPFEGTPVKESVVSFTDDLAAMIDNVTRRVAPKWTVSNTAGSVAEADGITAASTAAFEEFLLRPNSVNWSGLENVAALVARRLAADAPSPYLILDSYPDTKATTDPRTRSAVLAYYYLLADPDKTFLMFFGGYQPAAAWRNVFVPAAAVDVGQPTAAMTVWATGTDPQRSDLAYRVYGREYGKALVLFKPTSFAPGKAAGTTDDATVTRHQLAGNYRVLNSDGTLGPIVTSVSLRNGEGVTLMKA